MNNRITREEMLMEVVTAVAKRGTCLRQPEGGIGAVIARGGRPFATGYVGAPAGMPHCLDVGCDIDEARGGCIRTVHAEANAIAFAAAEGVATREAHFYCTYSPCIDCAKLVVNAGISQYVYSKLYRDDRGLHLLHAAGISCFRLIYPKGKPHEPVLEPFDGDVA